MMDRKENQNRSAVKPINKTGKTGLTRVKKEILKKMMGSVTVPIDINTIRMREKYGENWDAGNGDDKVHE